MHTTMGEDSFAAVWIPRIQVILIFLLLLFFILYNTFG